LKRAALLLAAALGACAGAPAPGGAGSVTLERGPCNGRCPVYSVAMGAPGEIVFEGKLNVAQPGVHRRRADPSELPALLAELDRLGAFALASSYARGTPACGGFATDMPTVRFTVDDGERSVAVTHDLGCRGAPAALEAIEKLIDQRTGTDAWIRGAPTR
jgi:hypothetical protein